MAARANESGPSDSHPVPHESEGDVTPREPDWGDVSSLLGEPKAPGELGRLGPYRILKELGRGGMGVVLLGEHLDLHRPAAIKMMLPRYADNDEAKARFMREARAVALIRHENVVLVYGVGTHGTPPHAVPYIDMELLAGESLEARMRAAGTIPLAGVVRIGRQVAAGLTAAHRLGVVHRDIKPGNLWLTAPDDTVKLLDFGLARDARDPTQLTAANQLVGTPAYLSPEQARGQCDPRSDLFSLGIVLYRLTTGRLPFTGRVALEVLNSLANDTPPAARQWNPAIPPELDQLIMRLLAKPPDDRPQTAAEVAAELALIGTRLAAAGPADAGTARPPADGSVGVGGPSLGPTIVGPGWRKGNAPAKERGGKRWLVAAALLTVLLAVVIGIYATMRSDRSKEVVGTNGDNQATGPGTSPTTGEVPPDTRPRKPSLPVPGEVKEFQIAAGVEMTFCWIPPGNATLGSPADEPERSKTGEDLRAYTTGGFWLAKCPVTQAEYQLVTGSNPSAFSKTGDIEDLRKRVVALDTSRFPVECVSRVDAMAFVEKVNDFRRTKNLAVVRLGLPDPDQWEYACRGGHKDGRPFYWGQSLNGREANCNGQSPYGTKTKGSFLMRTTEVGSYKGEGAAPHPWGLCDMTGNVWQWCGKPKDAPAEETRFALRGGGWSSPAAFCRTAFYYLEEPTARKPSVGFRLCIDP